MINLLPPEEKRELLFIKNKKLVIVVGSVALISLICLMLVLSSLKFYILGEINSRKYVLDNAEKKYQAEDFLIFKSIVQKYNKTLDKIDAFYKSETYLAPVLKTVFEISRPAGISFTTIMLNRDTKNNVLKVTLSGISDTRDNLLIFRENIINTKKIENVYFSPEDWVKPKDTLFDVTFEIHNN